jgi:hypothetical protein
MRRIRTIKIRTTRRKTKRKMKTKQFKSLISADVIFLSHILNRDW